MRNIMMSAGCHAASGQVGKEESGELGATYSNERIIADRCDPEPVRSEKKAGQQNEVIQIRLDLRQLLLKAAEESMMLTIAVKMGLIGLLDDLADPTLEPAKHEHALWVVGLRTDDPIQPANGELKK